MERLVNFRNGQDLSETDFDNIGKFAQQSFDHLVYDAVSPGRKYAQFDAAKSGALTMQVQPGRLYVEGEAFYRDTVFNHDFTSALPLNISNRKICALVGYGEELQTADTTREILIDPDTMTTEGQTVAMETQRVARLAIVNGQESPDPLMPAIATGLIVIAIITLSVTGVDAVDMVAANRLASSDANAVRLDRAEADLDAINPKVAGLAGDIAALTEGQKNLVDKEQFGRTLGRIAILESGKGVPTAAVDSFADMLLDETATDTAFAGYDAKVEEGIRFPEAAAVEASLTLKNPIDPAAKVVNGVLLPAYGREVRFSTGQPSGELKLNGYSYAVNTLVTKTMARYRVRFGPWRYLSSTAAFLMSGKTDILNTVFAKSGESLVTNPTLGTLLLRSFLPVRRSNIWVDQVEESYWDQVTVEDDVPGFQVNQTFLQANDGVLMDVSLWFPRLATDGEVTVAICETEHGAPRIDRVIAKTTVPRNSLVQGKNLVPIQPTALTGGQRYAIVIITASDHYAGTVQNSAHPQGTLFYMLDGQFQQGDGTKDLAFELGFAKFTSSRAVLDLGEVTLAGGIADLDILAQSVIPGATAMTFFAQIGGIWQPVAEGGGAAIAPGGAMQNILPLRVVMTGTPEVMPMLTLTGSQIRATRPKLTFNYVSAIRNLPGAGSTQIRATYRLEGFHSGNHAFTPKLLTGALYATETAPSSTSDAVQPDGSIERTAVWNLGAAVTSYRHKLGGTTDSPLSPYHVANRRDYAL